MLDIVHWFEDQIFILIALVSAVCVLDFIERKIKSCLAGIKVRCQILQRRYSTYKLNKLFEKANKQIEEDKLIEEAERLLERSRFQCR